MPGLRVTICTVLALVAFAGNSLLCRAALVHTRGARAGRGDWLSALALFAYAAGFSFSYLHLTAAAGALLLFGAVQTTMIGYGIATGERLRIFQIVGLVLACAGLIGLLLP